MADRDRRNRSARSRSRSTSRDKERTRKNEREREEPKDVKTIDREKVRTKLNLHKLCLDVCQNFHVLVELICTKQAYSRQLESFTNIFHILASLLLC